MQWSFSNNSSGHPQYLSFKGAQEDKPKIGFDSLASTGLVTITTTEAVDSSHRTSLVSRRKTLMLEKQGGTHYTTPTFPPHHFDALSMHQSHGVRVLPIANPTNQISVSMTMPAVPTSSTVVGSTDLRGALRTPPGPAQLTIFYAGSVCVYDNVSPEKAQAIMLLAGNAPPVTPNATSTLSPVQAPIPKSSGVDSFVVNQCHNTTLLANPISITSRGGSQSAGVSKPSKISSPLGSFPATLVPSAVPQARKASLARFLEKRKEGNLGSSFIGGDKCITLSSQQQAIPRNVALLDLQMVLVFRLGIDEVVGTNVEAGKIEKESGLVGTIMDNEKLQDLKHFVELCKTNPLILQNPSLSFFKSFLESLGARVPSSVKSDPDSASDLNDGKVIGIHSVSELETKMGELLVDKHVKYIITVEKRKDDFESVVMEHLRLNGAYWGLTTLAIMGKLAAVDQDEVISWVMQCQHESGGFGGNIGHDPHVLYTLSAIQVLALFDKLHVLDIDKVSNYIAGLQNEDGSFSGDIWGEVDTRFSYIAILSLALLHQLDKIDIGKAVKYILSCKNVDGGFGCTPGAESHAGQIFCCVAALAITGSLHHVDKDLLGWWLCERQVKSGGLNGRPEKLPDVCYSWWVLSSLIMIDRVHWIDKGKLVKFILDCQDKENGGISDRPDDAVDVFHTYFGVAGLSLLEYPGIKPIDPAYALPVDVVNRVMLGR
ncbi:hypothetical protein HAX54_024342 [Datura stramonium]|uniref:protein geranylgeranyltransferase type II n=1 Tax=Datura stramonium TaxID=4076 RepID=A0ABS8S5C9_DATST|nr:hypothetical protein [Datura stramonium]